jgi:polar amino acid transport system substrate-binding protein
MFAKDAPLAAKVNEVITALKKDGTLAKIHETWFGTKPDEGLATSTVLDMPKL